MARYASPHQFALTEEIVPLDGPDLIDDDGSDDVKPAEAPAAGPGLGVIEPPAVELDREEPASTEPRADALVADRGTRAADTEGDDNVKHDTGELADEQELWVAGSLTATRRRRGDRTHRAGVARRIRDWVGVRWPSASAWSW